jgi:hypothetical protein
VFPFAARPIAVEYPEDAVITLHPIEGLEFVLEAVAALGNSSELAGRSLRSPRNRATGLTSLSRQDSASFIAAM